MMPNDAPHLNQWMTTTEIGEALSITRQSAHLMIKNGQFGTLSTIGPLTRPQYVVDRKEVEKLLQSRKFAQPEEAT